MLFPDTFAAPYIQRIYGMRDEIVRMNLPYLYDGIMGIARGKFGNMLKGTSGTADLVARFGYDTKQPMHCVRSMEVLERFAENGFSDSGEAIWFDGGGGSGCSRSRTARTRWRSSERTRSRGSKRRRS